MCLSKLFRKKKKVDPEIPKRLDLDKYKMRMSIKAICLFEKLSGKSFYTFNDDDLVKLVYAIFVTSNNMPIKESTFYYLISDERVSEWLAEKMKSIMGYIGQFQVDEAADGENEGQNNEDKGLTITSIANALIVQYGMDAHYVMEEMELWQIGPAYDAVEDMIKERYEEKRLWTYLSILPHIDGKKLNRPDKLMPFPWEAEQKKKKAEEELKNNQYAIKNLIGKKLDFIK